MTSFGRTLPFLLSFGTASVVPFFIKKINAKPKKVIAIRAAKFYNQIEV